MLTESKSLRNTIKYHIKRKEKHFIPCPKGNAMAAKKKKNRGEGSFPFCNKKNKKNRGKMFP